MGGPRRIRRAGSAGVLLAAALVACALVIVSRRGGSTILLRRLGSSSAPSKDELGNSYWTAIHSMAANLAPAIAGTEEHACNFLHAIANLYPCEECREHFSSYLKAQPPDCSSRDALLVWTCNAHNEVNRRKSKPVFECTLDALNARWGSCGCE